MQWRKEAQLGAHGPQQVKVGAISEGKGFVPRHGDGHAIEQGLDNFDSRRRKRHRRRQGRLTTGAESCGCSVQTNIQIIEFAGLDQAQMAAGQFNPGFPRQAAVPAQPFGKTAFEQLGVTQGTDTVG
ncbi:hypothetical protein D9M71_298640 [compost metagenome]